jgi:hypothetical protein
MAESFILNYFYKGIAEEVTCSLRISRYTYQFICTIDGSEIILEKDDEGRLRVLNSEPFSNKKKAPDPIRVLAVKDELEKILQEET